MNINLRNALAYIGQAKARLDINLKPRDSAMLDLKRCTTENVDAAFYSIASAQDCLEALRQQLEDLNL